MALTPEERQARREEASARRREKDAKFPGAIWDSDAIWLELETGNDYSMKVIVEPGKMLRYNPRGESFDGRKYWEVYIKSASDLAQFIAALIARYNAVAEETNAAVANIQVPDAVLSKIEPKGVL